MTVGVCCALALSLPAPLDVRLPVALAYLYTAMRPIFAIGYYIDPIEAGRIVGLIFGGFQCNFGALIYCTLTAFGFAQTEEMYKDSLLWGTCSVCVTIS
jgi:hypothetical protein